MEEFKESLLFQPDNRIIKESRDIKWKNLQEAYNDFELYTEQIKSSQNKNFNDKKSKARTRHKKNKLQQTLHLFDQMHEDLVTYWRPFGFLNKSKPSSFVYSILPSLKISRCNVHIPIGINSETQKEEEV